MIRAFNNHIKTNLPFLTTKKVLVAISGGIDSVVLTHLLIRANFDITLAHCNFSLRGKESNKDERFVVQLGENLQVPTHTIVFDTHSYAKKNGVSTQMAARDLRYNWFQKLCKEKSLDYIITAHQKDDIIETFLINLTRGTGINGLLGIPEINNNVARPMLPFTRQEVLIYATRNKLPWREDSSNSSIKYVRNKIRHKIVPVLKEINPSLLDSFQNTLDNLTATNHILTDRMDNVKAKFSTKKDDEIHFNCEGLLNLNNTKAYLFELFNPYGFTEYNDIYKLLNTQTGKQVFSKSHRLIKNRDVLILSEIPQEKEKQVYTILENTIKIKEPLKLKFKHIEVPFDTKDHKSKVFSQILFSDENTISLDFDKLEFPLTIRKWEKGDLFYPIGLRGKKKLSKFFKDEKFSLNEKDNTWLLCSNEKIVWVIGKRLDERFKVTDFTTKIFKIKIS